MTRILGAPGTGRHRVNLLKFEKLNDAVVSVYLASGEHVGNLKWIAGVWKFKAIGYEGASMVPGGGPLTERHNTTFAQLDAAAISAALLPG